MLHVDGDDRSEPMNLGPDESDMFKEQDELLLWICFFYVRKFVRKDFFSAEVCQKGCLDDCEIQW